MNKLHDVQVVFIHETAKGICVREDHTGKDIWLPKSQCQFEGPNDPPRRRDVGTLTAPEGLLVEKGLV
jgi:hypothetical protein